MTREVLERAEAAEKQRDEAWARVKAIEKEIEAGSVLMGEFIKENDLFRAQLRKAVEALKHIRDGFGWPGFRAAEALKEIEV